MGSENPVILRKCVFRRKSEAKQLAEKHGIEIVNEAGLVQMLESTYARFDPETLSILRDTRKFCPKCDGEMVLRTATKGPGAGKTEQRASMVPDLNIIRRRPTGPGYWKTWINQGRAGTLMPAFAQSEGGPLTKDQVDSLVDFLQKLLPRLGRG